MKSSKKYTYSGPVLGTLLTIGLLAGCAVPQDPGVVDVDDDSAYVTAREGAVTLAVKGRAPKTGYDR